MKNGLIRILSLIFVYTLNMSNLQAASITSVALPSDVVIPITDKKVDNPSINEIIKSFRELPRSERKARLKEVRKELKHFKQLKKEGKEPIASEVVIIICAILIPPLGVYLYEGEITNRFWISLLLTILFFIPGMIYSLLVVTDSI